MNLESTVKEILKFLEVGDKIYWINQKKPYTIKARNKRYIIVTQPFNFKKNVCYSIIDAENLICGPNNYVFNVYDYSIQADIDESLKALENGEYEISYRRRAAVLDCFDRFKKKNDKKEIAFTQEGAAVLSISDELAQRTMKEAYDEFKAKVNRS